VHAGNLTHDVGASRLAMFTALKEHAGRLRDRRAGGARP